MVAGSFKQAATAFSTRQFRWLDTVVEKALEASGCNGLGRLERAQLIDAFERQVFAAGDLLSLAGAPAL